MHVELKTFMMELIIPGAYTLGVHDFTFISRSASYFLIPVC